MFDLATWWRAKRLPLEYKLAGLTIREAEQHLRAQGMSQSQAKKYLAENRSRLDLARGPD